ncbi:Rrf2 family transcriptional regulator [Neobacillus mesonae]|nr:Rrf2 family transcriptional regulator [Neobacillus mesonae]
MRIQKESTRPAMTCPSTYKSFGLAVQALVTLEKHSGKCSSSEIANYLHSESTLIRRILKTLTIGEIIESIEGRDGGYRLKKDVKDITLAEVYSLLEVHNSISESMLDGTEKHCFADQIRDSFKNILSEIEQSTLSILETHTIGDLVEKSV